MPIPSDTRSPTSPTKDNGREAAASRLPEDLLQRLDADVAQAGGPLPVDPERAGSIGSTMFDLPSSEDHSVTVLLPREHMQRAPSQALVRIKSRGDKRTYLGMVTSGPFAEPNTLRADSRLLVAVTAEGGLYLPPHHGRVQVSILGEELADGTLTSPRLRPLPNSPVFALSDEESAAVLRTAGDIRFGLVVGHQRVVVHVPSTLKSVLPRHLAVLGTTGGGKTTTVSGLVQEARAAGMAVILLDVEGEYTRLHEPADDPKVLTALAERGLAPGGVPDNRMTVYHLIGRDTTNPDHPDVRPFSLQFARLSPHTAKEIMGLTDAQEVRFLKAYDIAKELLRELGIFPRKNVSAEERSRDERLAMELDEFERGYPRLTLPFLMDVVGACRDAVMYPRAKGRSQIPGHADDGAHPDGFGPASPALRTPEGMGALRRRVQTTDTQSHANSWRALLGRLGRLNRLRVFDTPRARPLIYKDLLRPGQVSVIDLSDSGASELTNLVIADLLRGVQEAQDRAYRDYERAKAKAPGTPPPTRVLLVIEEAHEFLSAERIEKMPILFEQVARIAKRGRKRWLGLAFVTQLPGHMPRQVFGLVNSYILHKITDPQVVNALQRTVGGIDAGLWSRLPSLAPGQAIVSFPHLARPLLVAVDPARAKLRMMDDSIGLSP